MPAPEGSVLVELGIIAGSALALTLVAWRLRLPAALGQLVAGIIIGPFGFKLVTNFATIEAMAEVGIVLLLFVVGLELDPFQLRAMRSKVLLFSFTEITFSFIAGLSAGFVLGWSIVESILLASVIGISSTALVAKILYERRAMTQISASIMMGALVIEDIIAILILSLIPTFAVGSHPSLLEVTGWAIRGILLLALAFFLGVYLAPRAIDKISQLEVDVEEAGFLLSLSLGFALAIVSSQLGFSAATGAFLMGFVIRGKRARFVHGKISPVRDLFLIIFFVSMGMLVDLSQLSNLTIAIPVVGLAFMGKYAGSYLGAVLSAQRNEANDIAIGMNPRGEFSFILAREASSAGLATEFMYPVAGTVVLVTALISALGLRIRGKIS